MHRILPRILSAFALAAVLATPLQAEGDAGAYLAARFAISENDFRSASKWYGRAILSDPGNPRLLQGAILAEIGGGSFDLAIAAARQLRSLGGEPNQLAEFALMADEAAREDYEAVLAGAQNGREMGNLVTALVSAWAKVGTGKMSEALEEFDALTRTPGLEAFGYYHKALALASVGDLEGADEILSGRAAGRLFLLRRGIFAHAQILSQLERNADALVALDAAFGTEPDPVIDALRRRLQAGEPVPFDTVRTARDGIAEAFFTVAAALASEADPIDTLLHLRVASHLRPDMPDATLLTADVLEQLGQHQLAAETYALFPPDNPHHVSAEIGRANALWSGGDEAGAIAALQALARSHPDVMMVQFSLGDMLRMAERFDEAEVAYTAAIDLQSEIGDEDWVLFFYRGIAHEQSQDWPAAEADLRRSLELNPTQPQVLNYLGYGLVDRGEKLEEALGLIEKAVAGDPDKGYIIDSLAWALFRLGRYQEALEPMERASVLEPVDPIVTDHLGDVYWMVGRKLEAQFQWRRALSFEPTEKDAERIRRKLEVGLDAVMAEEAAAGPVEAAENGN